MHWSLRQFGNAYRASNSNQSQTFRSTNFRYVFRCIFLLSRNISLIDNTAIHSYTETVYWWTETPSHSVFLLGFSNNLISFILDISGTI